MCLPYFLYEVWPPLSFWWTTVLLRQLCKKRLAVLPPPTPPTPPSPPPPPPPPLLLLLCCRCCCCCAAAELLLCCCCCHIRVPFLRVPKKICCASRCQSIFPFFFTCTRLFVFFGDLMNFSKMMLVIWRPRTLFRRFAHRKHSQSDARMNLAFFKFEGIIG